MLLRLVLVGIAPRSNHSPFVATLAPRWAGAGVRRPSPPPDTPKASQEGGSPLTKGEGSPRREW